MAQQEQGPGDASSLWGRPGFLVRRLHQISVAIFMDEMGELEITPVQFGALTVVAANPGLDQSALARELGIDRANVADVVARLSGLGLIERRQSASDRRAKSISLTAAGGDVLDKANVRFAKVHGRLLSPLAENERAVFLRLLMRLIEGNNDLGRTVLRLGNKPEGAS